MLRALTVSILALAIGCSSGGGRSGQDNDPDDDSGVDMTKPSKDSTAKYIGTWSLVSGTLGRQGPTCAASTSDALEAGDLSLEIARVSDAAATAQLSLLDGVCNMLLNASDERIAANPGQSCGSLPITIAKLTTLDGVTGQVEMWLGALQECPYIVSGAMLLE